jgi:hypothetical protein
MIEDEKSTEDPEVLHGPSLTAANDNGHEASASVDPRIILIARALGRHIAREHRKRLEVANDNTPQDE